MYTQNNEVVIAEKVLRSGRKKVIRLATFESKQLAEQYTNWKNLPRISQGTKEIFVNGLKEAFEERGDCEMENVFDLANLIIIIESLETL